MPDTLSSFTEAMALVPDNTSRLISPDDQRSVAISLIADRGGCFADPLAGPYVVPITVIDEWVDIPLALVPDMVASPANLFWRMDANGQLGYDYQADWPAAVVPAGYVRSVRFVGVVDIDPDNNVWQFAMALDGVPQEPFFTIDAASTANAMTFTVAAGQGIDVSLAPRVSMMVRNQSNTTDLDLLLFSMATIGGALA